MIVQKVLRYFLFATLSVSTLAAQAGYETRLENEVVTELLNEFAPFKSLSWKQYLALKESKNAQFLDAQRMMHQYLQSTSVTMMPGVTEEIGKWADILDKRPQIFDNPVIVQTGLEILSREVLKNEGAQCTMVINTIRFIAGGLNQWGKGFPGLDYRRNQLVIMHMFAAYSDNQFSNILPCQSEINDLAKYYPELKNKTAPGCILCETGKFVDRETRISVMVLAKSFMQFDPRMQLRAWAPESYFSGYKVRLNTPLFLAPPTRQQALYGFLDLQIKGPFNSKAMIRDEDDRNYVNDIPQKDSMEVFKYFAELAVD